MLMVYVLSYEKWQEQVVGLPVLDVRSPGEFARGHIPGAVNMPLFSDEERAAVGTTYKQVHPTEALLEGLAYVGPKMSGFLRDGLALAQQQRVAVYCARGGARSESMAWLMECGGLVVFRLEGGYKAYRRSVRDVFAAARHYIVLSGATGSGKTDILYALEALGEQVLDLEQLAHHKGSAFGGIGQPPQPTTEHFENNLQTRLAAMDPDRPVWVEDESRLIGWVYLPDEFWRHTAAAPLLQLDVPVEVRVDRLVRDYGSFAPEDLIKRFRHITKKLGGQRVKQAVAALEQGDLHQAARIALCYYDKAYAHSLARRISEPSHIFATGNESPQATAKHLQHYVYAHLHSPISRPADAI